jgi:hypothetical protein
LRGFLAVTANKYEDRQDIPVTPPHKQSLIQCCPHSNRIALPHEKPIGAIPLSGNMVGARMPAPRHAPLQAKMAGTAIRPPQTPGTRAGFQPQQAIQRMPSPVIQRGIFQDIGSSIGASFGGGLGQGIGTAMGYAADTALEYAASNPATSLVTAAAFSMGAAYIWARHRSWNNTKKGWSISVISYREGKFSDVIGHASIAFEHDGRIEMCAGFSPYPLPDDLSLAELKRLMQGTKGKVYDDSSMLNDGQHHWWRETFEIDKTKWDAAMRAANQDAISTNLWYNLFGLFGGYSCASWAVKIARAAGQNPGSIVSRYLLSIPRELSLYAA